MIKAEQWQLRHKYVLIELAVKSLQSNYQKAKQFKMKTFFLPLIESLLKELQKEFFNL